MTNELHLDSIKEKMVAYLNEHHPTLKSDSGEIVEATWKVLPQSNEGDGFRSGASCKPKLSASFNLSIGVIIDGKILQGVLVNGAWNGRIDVTIPYRNSAQEAVYQAFNELGLSC